MENKRSLSRYWLLLGVAALAIAGLFSLVLVAARAPELSDVQLFTDMFHKALVVHVDLSVLVWFLSMTCMMWSLLACRPRRNLPTEEAALVCFGLSIALIALSPLDGKGEALMSNYIPVIHSPIFFLGLALLPCGALLMLAHMLTTKPTAIFERPLQFGIFSAGAIAMIALAVFFYSALMMPPNMGGASYYELAFWGGGHVLQFAFTQIMMVCWLLLSKQNAPLPQGKYMYFLFSIGMAASMLTPLAFRYDISSDTYRLFFTQLMIGGNSIAPILLLILLCPALWCTRVRSAYFSALCMSVLLFLYGGILGGMIEGQNVVIPAHYHGSIVGITLAFMGTAYLLLPEFGWRDVSNWKLAFWQPIIYGLGQIMHVSGLAWSGGYGVLRKTPGGMADVSMSVKAAMGLMGIGGTLAVIGGFMFVVVVARAVVSCHPRFMRGS